MERSKKVAFVAHCLLNQNAMPTGKERAPGVVKEVVELLSEAGIGIVQLSDPEIESFGLDRRYKTKDSIDNKKYRALCKKHAKEIINLIETYMKKNYTIVGILGVEFSPTWGVHQIENGNRNVPGKGILIEELEEGMRNKRFQIPIIGVNLNNLYSSAEKIQSMINYA